MEAFIVNGSLKGSLELYTSQFLVAIYDTQVLNSVRALTLWYSEFHMPHYLKHSFLYSIM